MRMGLNEILSKLNAGHVTAGIVVLLSLIQISPIKLNPWDKLLGWFGKKMNGGVENEIKDLQKQVRDLWINNHRQSILTFARECRADIDHSAEEWSHILNLCEEYENYTEKNEITNGVVRQNTRYIRELYQELSREHRI